MVTRYSILSLFLFLFSQLVFSQDTDESLLNALRTDDIQRFESGISIENVNREIGKDSLVPLSYAAFYNSTEIITWLMKNRADINRFSGTDGRTPLMWAAIAGNPGMIDMLISNQANVNLADEKGNTALIYASAGGCLGCVYLLINAGAHVTPQNHQGLDAEFYAIQGQYYRIRNMLRKVRIESYSPEKDIKDGPHLKWIKEDRIKMYYFISKAGDDNVIELTKKYRIPGDSGYVKGLSRDKNQYFVRKHYEPQKAVYSDIDSILIIGDIHGDFLKVKDILKNSNVVNDNLSWKWGRGHVVFIGDIFDRGDDVTETLRLIKSLQHQARERGGGVHLLFGNHELMNLVGDNRYISDKYFYLASKTSINYSELFDSTWDLGRWLRSLNTVLKINDILIVHAGISPALLEKKLSINQINAGLRNFVAPGTNINTDSLGLFLTGPEGPLWYRGLTFPESSEDGEIAGAFDLSLEYYGVSRMIIGHTPDNNFRLKFGDRLICIDVSTSKYSEAEQALLIKNGIYYKVFADGSVERLFSE